LQVFFCIFFKKLHSCATMRAMPKLMKPLVVIILAVGVAAGAAVFLSRNADTPAANASTPTHVEITGGGHFRGPENARLTLVEFGDYQCPSCGAYHPFVKEIMSRYPDKLRLEFHHYPLISIHPNSMGAAMAAEAAGEQGHYWEMHDALFEHQQEWAGSANAEPLFVNIASHIGLDTNKFEQSLKSPALQERILKDVARAQDLKIQAVPTFFINGEQTHIKLSMEDFVQVIDDHLRK
jgi:protein-disulfide isomerase